MVLGLLLPAFLLLAPHTVVHALYDSHVIQHSDTNHHYKPENDLYHENEHDSDVDHENINHHVPIDFASYYDDFLHIDLKTTNKDKLLSKITSNQDIDYVLDVDIVDSKQYVLRYQQKRGPPIGHYFVKNYPSIYLTTLRIRI